MGCIRSLCVTALLCGVGCIPPGGGGSSGDDDGGRRGGDDSGRSRGTGGDATLTADAAPAERAPDIGVVRPAPAQDFGAGLPPDFGPPEIDATAPPRPDAGPRPPCDVRLPHGEVEPGFLEPASIITTLDLVRSEDVAIELGCEVEGGNRGTGLAGIQGLLGVNGRNLRIPLGSQQVDFLHISNWRPGASLSDREPVVTWHQGVPRGDTVESERRDATFVALDLDCPTLRARFDRPFPIFSTSSENPFNFILEYARIKVDIFPYADGFESIGTLTGYVTIEGMIRMIEELQEICSSDDPPAFCDQVQQVFAGPAEEVATNLVLPIVGGADARVDDDGNATDQCREDCNAVSACLWITGEPALRIFPQ